MIEQLKKEKDNFLAIQNNFEEQIASLKKDIRSMELEMEGLKSAINAKRKEIADAERGKKRIDAVLASLDSAMNYQLDDENEGESVEEVEPQPIPTPSPHPIEIIEESIESSPKPLNEETIVEVLSGLNEDVEHFSVKEILTDEGLDPIHFTMLISTLSKECQVTRDVARTYLAKNYMRK